VEALHPQLSITRQCELIGLPRSSWYSEPRGESAENLLYMRLIDEQYTRCPFYGSRRMSEWLKRQGYPANRKRVSRLMRRMGLWAMYPRPRLSLGEVTHRKYPYLLRDLKIERPNQVWCTDITYIRLRGGFLYLAAVMDWYSRYVLSWRLSSSLEVGFCLETLEEALSRGRPEIFNSDQGAQFTSLVFSGRLEKEKIRISMDGRGRAFDNIMIERLWRSVKYEEVYLKDYENPGECQQGLCAYFEFYNEQRLHQHLAYRTPQEVHHDWK
jgi:putative transposase